MNADERAIRAVIQTLIRGLQDNDMQLIGKVYAHSRNLLVFLEGPQVKLVGWKALRKAISDFLSTHSQIQSRLNKDCRFIADRELGVFYGTYRFKAVNRKSGKPIRWTARNTFLLRKTGKQWKVIHEHDSFPASIPSS